jgi:16S rRNA (uracil1498-N3)-methyltransferase
MLDEGALGDASPPSPEIVVSREEAQHAVRVKRAEIGEKVRLLDARGGIGTAEVLAIRPDLVVRVLERRTEPPVAPRVEVWSATPKGPRLEDMIEQLSQVGAALWRPLDTELGVVEPGEGKMDRCRRVARESAKQCGRAWVMEIGESATFEEALTPREGTQVIVGDASGTTYGNHADPVPRLGVLDKPCERPANIRILIGPEGGFTAPERSRMIESGCKLVRFGPHIMRIETAAVCAAARIIGG